MILRPLKKRDQGHSAVEFALALPVFVFLIMGIIEFGWFFFVQHTMQYATREGMRLALVGRTLVDPNNIPLSRKDSIIKMVSDNASIAVNPSPPTFRISIYPLTSTYTDPPGWEGTQDAGNPGDYMRVRTRYTYTFMTPLIGTFFGGITTIQSEGTYRNELFD